MNSASEIELPKELFRILVADDDAEICRLLERSLGMFGYTNVEAVADGKSVLAALNGNKPVDSLHMFYLPDDG